MTSQGDKDRYRRQKDRKQETNKKTFIERDEKWELAEDKKTKRKRGKGQRERERERSDQS